MNLKPSGAKIRNVQKQWGIQKYTKANMKELLLAKNNLNNNTAEIQSNAYQSTVTWITLSRQEIEIALLYIIPIKKSINRPNTGKDECLHILKVAVQNKEKQICIRKVWWYYFNHLNKVLSTEVSNQGTARGMKMSLKFPFTYFKTVSTFCKSSLSFPSTLTWHF